MHFINRTKNIRVGLIHNLLLPYLPLQKFQYSLWTKKDNKIKTVLSTSRKKQFINKNAKSQDPQTQLFQQIITEELISSQTQNFVKQQKKKIKPQVSKKQSRQQILKQKFSKYIKQDPKNNYHKTQLFKQIPNGNQEPHQQSDQQFDSKNKKRGSRMKLMARSHLRNSQQFLFQSQFHKEGLKYLSIFTKIQAIDQKFISKQKKQELFSALKQISQERQLVLSEKIKKEKIYEQLIMLSAGSRENIKIKRYVQLYNKISSLVEKIIDHCQSSQQPCFKVHHQMLRIIQSLSLREYYTYYLLKLIGIQNKTSLKQMQYQEANFYWFVIEKLSRIEYAFAENHFPFHLQKHLQQFFSLKLPLIIEKYDFKRQITEKQQKLFLNQITLLMHLEQILKNAHVSFGKQIFFANYINKNIHHFTENQILQTQLKQVVLKAISLFYLSVENLYLDKEIIRKFQGFLTFVAQKYDPQNYVSDRICKLLIVIYEKIGSIPDVIYDFYLAEFIYNSLSKNDEKLVQTIKFYVYAQFNDKNLLLSLFGKLDNRLLLNNIYKNKSLNSLLHFLIHYMCIKYPSIANHKISTNILKSCTTNTVKDHFVLSQIMNFVKNQKTLYQNKSETKKFTSLCIEKEAITIEKKFKSELSSLQQKIFKVSLQKVVNKLNENSNKKYFYEIRENFSFCNFELDFVVLKWKSQERQKLIGYLDIECVGLQYSYDAFALQDKQQMAIKLQSMSLIQYEKGLKLIRKKITRQQILKHYEWKILYVPNKFLQEKNISKQKFEQKLEQAILEKLSQKKPNDFMICRYAKV